MEWEKERESRWPDIGFDICSEARLWNMVQDES